jgi:hypothetical protein
MEYYLSGWHTSVIAQLENRPTTLHIHADDVVNETFGLRHSFGTRLAFGVKVKGLLVDTGCTFVRTWGESLALQKNKLRDDLATTRL